MFRCLARAVAPVAACASVFLILAACAPADEGQHLHESGSTAPELHAAATATVASGSSSASTIAIDAPRARATPPVATMGAVYLNLTNHLDTDEQLIAARTPVAERVEVHHTEEGAGMTRMRSIDALSIPSHGSVMLAPGGTHLMLIGLKTRLQAGERFPLTLTFRQTGDATVDVEVVEQPEMPAG